ncbi:MAG: Uma2 family endonuclease [Anaerolineae bacterium]|nr:Uma2 family endonuclease [Anaerolineae bacterium]
MIEQSHKRAIREVPNFAVEVKSPSDKLPKLRTKVAYYLSNGTRLVWLVIPDKRLVEVYRPDEPVLVCGEDDFLDGANVLPGFKVAVKDLFAD